ncbi:hypothetical protein [Rhodoferax sp. BLA1]|uniref:hypothetical protein n=1 Tax=Rhodoferax sp. BLA1 TaxID=2576062 RepID=UPI0015D3DE8F|nr:hypothetical protein [Rhodoferax sp. BLA1]
MPRPSVIPTVKAALEEYLERMQVAFLAVPEEQRAPTLPATPDGKVNVRALAQAIDLKQTQEKYLYERLELTSLINLVAEGQGLLPIGSRLLVDASDKALKERLVRQAQSAKANAQAAVEAQSATGELLEKLKDAVLEIETLKAQNMRLKAQLEMIHSGMMVGVVD